MFHLCPQDVLRLRSMSNIYENQILPALSDRCMSACTRQINHGAVVRQILYCTVEKLAVPHVTVGTAAERSRWLPLLQNSPSFSSESMHTVVSAKVIACIPTVPPIAEHHSNSFVVHILMLTYCTYILANPKLWRFRHNVNLT